MFYDNNDICLHGESDKAISDINNRNNLHLKPPRPAFSAILSQELLQLSISANRDFLTPGFVQCSHLQIQILIVGLSVHSRFSCLILPICFTTGFRHTVKIKKQYVSIAHFCVAKRNRFATMRGNGRISEACAGVPELPLGLWNTLCYRAETIHQSLDYSMPGDVCRTASGGGARIEDEFNERKLSWRKETEVT